MLEGALELAAAGYKVLPVGSKKSPSASGAIYAADTDPEVIRGWHKDRRLKNVGIATGVLSGIVVADADTAEAAKRLEAKYGPPHVRSKRGAHWYFKHPKDGRIKSVRLEGDVDIKADGGYVLAPPSTGKTWTNGIPVPSKLPKLPEELRPSEAAELPKRPRLTEDKLGKAIRAVYKHYPEEGLRYEFGRHLSGYLLRHGIAPEDAYAIQYEALELTPEGADKEAEKNIGGVVTSTAKRLAEGEPVTGGPNVEEYAPGLTGDLAGIFGWGPKQYELTDPGNAERFVDTKGRDFRYVYEDKAWVRWTGARWEVCSEDAIRLEFVDVALSIYEEARRAPTQDEQRALAAFARASQNKTKADGAIAYIRAHLTSHVGEFDKNPDLLNVENGTIDLTTGELREHRREDLIRKIAPVQYDPDAEAPLFEKFISEVLTSPELVRFVQRFLGYSLTGHTEERTLAVLFGPQGKNGKSTLLELFHDLLGDYAATTTPEILLQQRYASGTDDYNLAKLAGARFVTTAESDENRSLAEARIKQITGGDTISARAPYGLPFEYKPQFKLWFSTNNRPNVRGTDDAIWDRIKLIPFLQRFEGKREDKRLPRKLRDELSGILAWAVRGCVEWAKTEDLGSAAEVDEAGAEYREEQDTFARFLSDCCEMDPEAETPSEDFWKAWSRWAEEGGEELGTRKLLWNRLSGHGIRAVKGAKNPRRRSGARLLTALNPPPDSQPPSPKSPANTNIQHPSRAVSQKNEKLSKKSYSHGKVTANEPLTALTALNPPPAAKTFYLQDFSGREITVHYLGAN